MLNFFVKSVKISVLREYIKIFFIKSVKISILREYIKIFRDFFF